jgi:hypothetical protein
LVSIFEATLKIEIRRYRKVKGDSNDQIDAAMKKIGSRLQSVSSAVTLVSESCDGISLFPVGSGDERKLDRVFHKRHPITHNLGVVDRKYIDKVRSGELEGTEVRVDKEEVLQTAQTVYLVLSEFHSKLFSLNVLPQPGLLPTEKENRPPSPWKFAWLEILSAFRGAESAHEKDDKAYQQNQAKPAAADDGTSKVKPAAAEQEKQDNQE